MGQHDEYLRLFLAHEADVRAFIGSLVRDYHVRDDILQDVAAICWRQFDQYDHFRSFGAWARGIAANKIKQSRAESERFPMAFEPAVIEAVREAFDRTEAQASPRLDALRLCVESLPQKSRRLLETRYGEGRKPEQIARQLRSTRDAVYKALARLRAKLEDCIRRRLALEEV